MAGEMHTRGPWALIPHGGPHMEPDPNYWAICAGSDEDWYANMGGFRLTGFISPADAHLIAAAPELLAVAESLQKWLMKDAEPSHISSDDMRVYHLDGGILNNLLNEARAALAKARGETPTHPEGTT